MQKKKAKKKTVKKANTSRSSQTAKGASRKKNSSEASQTTDIIQLILQDHKPLKELIETMKDSEASFKERWAAFEEFAPLLTLHAKAEEKALYTVLKEEEELREEGFEGDVEHSLADEMVHRTMNASDEDSKGACIKVLAELVEHHIEEEEEELLPEFKKESEASERTEIGSEYLRLKAELENEVSMEKTQKKSPASINRPETHA